MKYKVKNISTDRRKFYVKKSPKMFILESKEEITIEFEPMKINCNHFKVTNIEKIKSLGVTPKKKRIKKRRKI